ncbi:MAG: 50S ribosomal protein L33 [Candidatus Parcubacteria bacterium]|nr:MAG: 50S ribosomal protein L33 [Candidatus Parcubacteria bacterium]
MAVKTRNLVRLKCSQCQRANYYYWKKKGAEKKLELNKFCKWCKKHTKHKESRK